MEPFSRILHRSFHPDIVPTTIKPSPPLGPPLTASPNLYPFSFSYSTRDLVSGLVLDLLVVLVVVLVIYICVRRNPEGSGTESPRSGRGRDRQETTSSPRVDPTTIIQALPVYSYGEDTKYQVTCAICLGEFEEEEAVKVIPFCKHVFHRECIDRWLSSQVTCPVCRCTHLLDQGVSKLGERSRVRNDET
ncbi:RING-H2 finger protein ATL32 [Morella rubra]|uniref:RING-type E3 ubiquitin transferase n=1 Tax=Morella rubra TaxID=262757 RepID=A0A6A1WUF0_9ROSI|nr:RING-H2 finger protein ATL32 [Morella rubra]